MAFPLFVALAVQAAAAPEPPRAPTMPQPPNRCPSEPKATGESDSSRDILICGERGYRINPDILEARREKRSGGPPVRPNGVPRPDCASVGPAPCTSAGVNLMALAMTAGNIAARLAKGKEIGSIFVTDPHPSEYQLYMMAKRRREAREAEEAALAAARAAKTAAGPRAADKSSADPPR